MYDVAAPTPRPERSPSTPGRAQVRDPARTLAMLWGLDTSGARGPRPARSAEQVASAAVGLADAQGALSGLSMRRVAEVLEVGTMSLYTYVQNKDDLVDLVVDRAYGEVYPGGAVPGERWQDRVRSVARANWDLFERHAWLLDVDLARPVLGPGETRKYDLELRALDGIGLDDVAMDATVTLVVSHAASAARRAREARRVHTETGQTDDEWWADNAPVLQAVAELSVYDVAGRVGSAVGEAQHGPYSPAAELEFGVERIVDGVAALLERTG